ncbi:MAG: helix-turn-helix domain-containing protein [Cytophagales bacterium]
MANFFHIKSITEATELVGLPKPLHPLITIIRKWPHVEFDHEKIKITSELYTLSLKGKMDTTAFQYGRSSYDFEEGTLVFIAPNQIMSFSEPIRELDDTGWTILFHPDLIRKSELGKKISEYSFFDYETNDALHLSEHEKETLQQLVERIDIELQRHIDKHSQDLIIANLDTILKYCLRYYERQFYTRANQNKDIIIRFEEYLKTYFNSINLENNGMPTLTQCGEALNISGSYLSDLLKIETGKSAKEHIHGHLIEKAKTQLLNTNVSINEVAFSLGFEYPQHFSKLFKAKTGFNPTQYRSLN